ncbi:unnamed protein product [Thelazia callipaeda]|uniref:protein-serine/threonine phosphatase n=1 Tax=Thelazia callipaeda TaxID=103827 RepID=A0A158RBJ6_THECL|nr:unnamed protein product [Thelazia callipaeda]
MRGTAFLNKEIFVVLDIINILPFLNSSSGPEFSDFCCPYIVANRLFPRSNSKQLQSGVLNFKCKSGFITSNFTFVNPHLDKVIVGNAGDSRAVLCRNGLAIELSVDHKPEDETERRRIEAAGGEISNDGRVNGGLNLSRALGDHFYKKNEALPLKEQMISALPDVKQNDILCDDEFVIVACDGIWNSLSSQQAVDFVRQRIKNGLHLKEICEQICDYCLSPNTAGDGTGCDNMTVILVQIIHPT